MLTRAEALAALLDGVDPLPPEDCPLAGCVGRTLAEEVTADRSQPPDPVSAMDGYAMREADARAGAVLRVIGDSPAGAPYAGEVGAGTAVRIATGGVVPIGAERVVMQELVDREGDRVQIREQPGDANFVRGAGSDFAAGQTVLAAGEWLTPARIALAAAANRDRLRVRAVPRIQILTSGDELREPGSPVGKGEIVNSAGYAIEALVNGWGGAAGRLPPLPDDLEAGRERLAGSALDAEVIVSLGGASVGDRDVLRPLFGEMGAEIRFDRVAVQPGKPTWHARFPDGRLVLGLPGNPASAFVCAWLFLKPLLHKLLGGSEPALIFLPAVAGIDFPANGARESFLRGTAAIDSHGRLIATAGRQQDSHLQLSLAKANALIRRLPNASPLRPGAAVELLLIAPL